MTAPIGAVVGLTYDADPGVVLATGDFLTTKSGRAYLIISVAGVRGRPDRWKIRALVIEGIPEPHHRLPGTTAHELVWHSRDKR